MVSVCFAVPIGTGILMAVISTIVRLAKELDGFLAGLNMGLNQNARLKEMENLLPEVLTYLEWQQGDSRCKAVYEKLVENRRTASHLLSKP